MRNERDHPYLPAQFRPLPPRVSHAPLPARPPHRQLHNGPHTGRSFLFWEAGINNGDGNGVRGWSRGLSFWIDVWFAIFFGNGYEDLLLGY